MKENNSINNRWRQLQTRSGVLLLLTAAILLQAGSAIQYYFSRNGIREEVSKRATSELELRSLKIEQMVTRVETAIGNLHWTLEQSIVHQDSIYPVLHRLMMLNPDLVGCAIAFPPNYFKGTGYWYEPYVFRNGDVLENKQIGSANHDYFNTHWYTDAMASDHGLWTEPYIDSIGSEGMVCSYVVPLCDASGRTVAVFAADVLLDWLGDICEQEASVYTYLFSDAGRLMVCPDSSMVMRYTMEEVASLYNDTLAAHLHRAVLQDLQGAAVVDYNGEKSHIYFSPVGGHTGWSMLLLFPDKEIYKGLHHVSRILIISMLLGLILLGFILWRTFRSMRNLGEVRAEKERIGSELLIAHNIQMGMLPKTFPPSPDCKEVAIFGSLEPAKEVGGDLYDFHVQNDHLLFCVGDVSGKGVPASLMMAVTRSLFRTVSYQTQQPDEIMKRINDSLSEMNENLLFVTFFVGILDLKTGHLSYSNAGHCAPVIIGSSLSTLKMDTNIPLGVMSGWDYTKQECHIDPGSIIFLYTDGLNEAQDAVYNQFGEKRMMAELEKMGSATPRQLIDHMSAEIHRFENGTEQSDDLTMLAIKYTKGNPQTENIQQ